jgi:hypothetical protein
MTAKLSAKAFLVQVGTFLPAPALLIFGQWRSIFSNIGLSNPAWEYGAGAIGAGVGTVLALVIQQIGEVSDTVRLKRYARGWTIAFVLLICTCFVISSLFDHLPNQTLRQILNEIWKFVFAAAMCTLCLTLTYAAMAKESEGRWIFWGCLVLGAIVIFGVSYGVFRYFGC